MRTESFTHRFRKFDIFNFRHVDVPVFRCASISRSLAPTLAKGRQGGRQGVQHGGRQLRKHWHGNPIWWESWLIGSKLCWPKTYLLSFASLLYVIDVLKNCICCLNLVVKNQPLIVISHPQTSNFCLSDSNMSMTNLLPIFLLHVSGRPYWNQCLIFRVPLLKSLRMFLVSHVMWTIFQYNVIQHEQQCRILTPGKTNWPAKPFKPLSDSHYLRAHQLRSQDDIWAARKIL